MSAQVRKASHVIPSRSGSNLLSPSTLHIVSLCLHSSGLSVRSTRFLFEVNFNYYLNIKAQSNLNKPLVLLGRFKDCPVIAVAAKPGGPEAADTEEPQGVPELIEVNYGNALVPLLSCY